MKDEIYLQYGCGFSAPIEWINFDASPTLRFERLPVIGKLYSKNESRFPDNVEYGDIVKGLPVLAGTCSAIYCSHVLEHLSLDDFRLGLINTYKLLQEGGTFRLVLPDLEYLVKIYAESPANDAAMIFMYECGLGLERRPKGLKAFIVSLLGNSQHFWMWDYKAIELELLRVGFSSIRRASFGDSKDNMFQLVEDEVRWSNCLGVECRKSELKI